MVAEYDWVRRPRDLLEKKFSYDKRVRFLELAADIHPVISHKPNCPNYRYLTTEKKLAITLYYLKYTSSLWMTANTFGIHQCTVSKTLKIVCKESH